MNNKITGGSLYPDIYFGQFRFLDVLYRVIQTKLLQEPLFAHYGVRLSWWGPLTILPKNFVLGFFFGPNEVLDMHLALFLDQLSVF